MSKHFININSSNRFESFSHNNVETKSERSCVSSAIPCKPGIILPVWYPRTELISTGEQVGRAFVYALSLIYIFFGVNVIADKFMSAIEVITSQEKEIKMGKDINGEQKKVVVRYWNETISNLTLMALGSSASEVLLSVIEIFGENFEAGELGPNVIVGSAAYNLFIIVGFCVLVVPKGEVRKIKKLRVFFVTASWMIFAYVWLCMIILVFSPGIVEVWEAVLTCLYFPLTVLSAYLVDKKMYLNASKFIGGKSKLKLKRVREEKSIANSHELNKVITVNNNQQSVYFDPAFYTCSENIGELDIFVCRYGGDLSRTIKIDYKTEEESAEANRDYIHKEGTLVFEPFVTKLHFNVNILEDDIYNGDETFKIKLMNVRYENESFDNNLLNIAMPDKATVMILDDDHGGVFSFEQSYMEVIESIGILRIKVLRKIGAKGKVKIPYKTVDSKAIGGKDFKRKNDILIFYNNEIEKEIHVEIVDHEEYERNESFFIELGDPVYEINEKTKTLFDTAGIPELGDPHRIEIKIKENSIIRNIIDKLFVRKNSIKNIKSYSYIYLWMKQIKNSFNPLSDDDDDEDDDNDDQEESKTKKVEDDNTTIASSNANESKNKTVRKKPRIIDYIIHCFNFFWKFLFAFVPPAEIWKGYPCFFVSLIMIGVFAALIGDLASHFGCTVGLKDSISAITFVALGSAAPDTLASKIAAIHDKYADNSVGNVNGSSGLNVFVGIGLPWLIAAAYHLSKGTTFKVNPGSLAFSVTIYSILAFIALIILMLRRNKIIGGELGGPLKFRILTALAFLIFWLLYVTLSALEAYCIIKGF